MGRGSSRFYSCYFNWGEILAELSINFLLYSIQVRKVVLDTMKNIHPIYNIKVSVDHCASFLIFLPRGLYVKNLNVSV